MGSHKGGEERCFGPVCLPEELALTEEIRLRHPSVPSICCNPFWSEQSHTVPGPPVSLRESRMETLAPMEATGCALDGREDGRKSSADWEIGKKSQLVGSPGALCP